MNLLSIRLNVSAADEDKMNLLLDSYLNSGLEIIPKRARTNHLQCVPLLFLGLSSKQLLNNYDRAGAPQEAG